jgi:hypothetical protein
MRPTTVAFLTLLVLAPGIAGAQSPSLEAPEKRLVVESAAKTLERDYVFADVAAKMGKLILENLGAGRYDAISGREEFAQRLTDDLRSVSHDRHLRVAYAPEFVRSQQAQDEAAKRAAEQEQRRRQRLGNFAFREVRILPGNVGYLRFDGFSEAPDAFHVAVGAMAFLANSDALILDLRQNGGGSPQMIQLISTYLFEGEPKHLNSFEYRGRSTTEQFWTLPFVPGARRPAVPVYVLTSARTFSAAEEFTYNLKNLERATIVGETTGGGAHPVRMEVLAGDFAIGVPYARAVNPISKSNWEGTGVEPDVKVAAAEALETAQRLALERLAAKETDARLKAFYQWPLEALAARATPFTLDAAAMREYVGAYGPRQVTLEGGSLYYRRGEGRTMKMIPMAADLFRFDELDTFRLRVVRENGRITALEGLYDDGTTDRTPATGR